MTLVLDFDELVAGLTLDPLADQFVLKAEQTVAAGIAVRAADTKRLLMIQRANDPADPAAGTWEFPGGHIEEGEHPLLAAKREWQEEMGTRLPRGQHVGEWRSGVYHGFVHEVPRESSVRVNLDPANRSVLNPDDPDGDKIEVAAWWDPEHLRRNSALRPELRASKVWNRVEKADAHAATVHLRVHGVSRTPDGQRIYRMVSRDGHYVGRTNPTGYRARKGDVLKVQANDFLQDAQGDLRWMNANVVAGYNDSPHSWRELQAFAGGTLVKDGAPGPAGDLPAAVDQGTSSMPSGPTLSAVHIPAPLPNVSQAYVGRRGKGVLRGAFLPVAKADRWKQLAYGIVLEPNILDSQDDFMLPHHVEKAAHAYLAKAIRGRSSVVKLQHRRQGFKKDRASIVPVESFVAPADFSYDGKEMIKKGTWVMVMHVEDPKIWEGFLDGTYTGFSVGGSGIRHSVAQSADLAGEIGYQQPNLFEPDVRRLAGNRG